MLQPPPAEEIEHTLRMIRYAVDLMGIDGVGIGTHFNSMAIPWITEALLEAGEEGWTEDVVHIMESGLVYIDRADEVSGNSAMMNAAVAGHVDTVTECLARDAQGDPKCALDQTALVKAAGMGFADIVKLLLSKSAVRAPPPAPTPCRVPCHA